MRGIVLGVIFVSIVTYFVGRGVGEDMRADVAQQVYENPVVTEFSPRDTLVVDRIVSMSPLDIRRVVIRRKGTNALFSALVKPELNLIIGDPVEVSLVSYAASAGNITHVLVVRSRRQLPSG